MPLPKESAVQKAPGSAQTILTCPDRTLDEAQSSNLRHLFALVGPVWCESMTFGEKLGQKGGTIGVYALGAVPTASIIVG
jgi:hypothetical protein